MTAYLTRVFPRPIRVRYLTRGDGEPADVDDDPTEREVRRRRGGVHHDLRDVLSRVLSVSEVRDTAVGER